MNRWIAVIPAVILVLALGMFATKSLHRQSKVEPTATVGQPAPDLSLVPLEGGPAMALRPQIKGPALVNLFASYCGPCIIEHPYLMGLKAKGVRIIGIAWEDKPADTAAFLAKRGDPYELVLTDPKGEAGVGFGISGISETFVIDSTGKIVAKHYPMTSQADADKVLAQVKAAR